MRIISVIIPQKVCQPPPPDKIEAFHRKVEDEESISCSNDKDMYFVVNFIYY